METICNCYHAGKCLCAHYCINYSVVSHIIVIIYVTCPEICEKVWAVTRLLLYQVPLRGPTAKGVACSWGLCVCHVHVYLVGNACVTEQLCILLRSYLQLCGEDFAPYSAS